MTRAKEITLLITSLLLASCKIQIPAVDIKCSPTNQNNASQTSVSDKRSDNIKIEIQVDGTPSMQGFVKNTRQSRYEQTLELLDVIANASWSRDKSDIDYYRFGTKRNGINKQTYINAQRPDFYQQGGVYLDGQITAAIPSEPTHKDSLTNKETNRLSIIVTDLYQTDSDISSAIGQLKRKYLQQGYAAGILGIKSEFNGQVYDIGVRKQTRSYNTSGKKPEEFRPFYVIILGSYQDVSYYFEQLQQQGRELINSEQFIIFYPRVIESSSTLDLSQFPPQIPPGQNQLRKVSSFNNGEVRGRIVDKTSTLALMLQEDAAGTHDVRQTISYSPSPYTLRVDSSKPDAFIPQINGEKFNLDAKTFQPHNSQGLQFGNWQIDDSETQLTFSTSVDSKKIQPGIYNFNVNLIPHRFQDPEWWQTWNFDEGSFDRTGNTEFDGSTTLNLINFMQGLKSVTAELVETNSTVAANLCYGVQRD